MTRRLTNAGIALLLIIALMGFLGVLTGVRGDSRQSYSLTAAENESRCMPAIPLPSRCSRRRDTAPPSWWRIP